MPDADSPPAEERSSSRDARARRTTQRIAVETLTAAAGIALVVWAASAGPSWIERHATAVRCIRDAEVLRVGSARRVAALLVAAILLFVVRPALGRRVTRHPLTKGAVARNALSAVLALASAELVLRKPWYVPPVPPRGSAVCPPAEPDPTSLYTLAHGTDNICHAGGRDFHYAINAEGNRAPSATAESDHTRPTLFVAGESIAVGLGIPYEETFGALIERETGLQVVNLAVHGYGLDQAYLHTKSAFVTYAHPVALVMLFVPEQAERSELEDRSRLRVGPDGELINVPATPVWIRDVMLRKRWRDFYHGDAEAQDLRALARATSELARARGAYPLFVTTNYVMPCQRVGGREPWLFKTLFDDQAIPRVHVELALGDRVGATAEDPSRPVWAVDDLHPGRASHRRLADAVLTSLRTAGVIP